ncbi:MULTISPECIES: hypothetical protein [Burkholderia]|uniref:hypothetical protein n=1 Tax=Burkholderia TaxID=32008 RepID=UPI000753F096|nr:MULTISPECIES: hypothetical protein [Burkholderia]AOJ73539.1 BsaT protein [Burkholderia savannae]KVG38918.1 BsaT protein [Burkholderia sp. MSMB0265]KVG81644.1 BsaT protein [Burkholderia sp. MSMB2040]KVG98801.1 BsaT protein [Burkholderia sp. MSMB2042]KVG98982.1 BsaT protein [Burkholderia sp. MSMB2041]
MKRLGDARRLIAVLERREWSVRQQAERERKGLSNLDARIVEHRASIERLRDRLAATAPPKSYARAELMRVRGKQAAIRFEIACKQIEADDLLEQRLAAERALRESLAAALALERRQNKHRNWLARRRLENDLLHELAIEAEIIEGASHGFNQRY